VLTSAFLVLMSTIIDNLQNELKDSPDSSSQYFICSARDDSTRLAARIKAQLIYQIYELSLTAESHDVLDKANDEVASFLRPSDVPGGAKDKKAVAAGFQETYVSLAHISKKKIYLVIDALDECTDRQESGLLKMLQSMLSSLDVPEFRLKLIICS